MKHYLEISGYTETNCGNCLKWYGKGGRISPKLCGPYNQALILGRRDTSPRRCTACLADEKRQKETES